MPGPYKGFLTQHTTQQQHAKPRHQPSDRDQRARDRLRNKVSAFQAKIKSPVYIALGTTALQTVYQTFDPDFPVTFHLPMLTTKTDTNTIPTLYVIQEDRHCMPTQTIILQTFNQTLKPGETRVYPSMLAEKQVPVLDLTNSTITSVADLQTAFHSLNLCSTEKEDPSHGRKQPSTEEDTH